MYFEIEIMPHNKTLIVPVTIVNDALIDQITVQ